jgi:archaellum component FlaF (FlaF/FlaG flagellin family)
MSLIFSRSKAIILMLLTLLILFLFTRSEAQQFYPVQVRSYVQSPSVFIEDYKDPNNFRVQVTLTDLTVPSLDVILNVTFNGPSIKFESTTGIPLHLVGGVTYTLDREDLGNLLSTENLPGAPVTLPEDAYVISFKSIERNSNTPVSNAL